MRYSAADAAESPKAKDAAGKEFRDEASRLRESMTKAIDGGDKFLKDWRKPPTTIKEGLTPRGGKTEKKRRKR